MRAFYFSKQRPQNSMRGIRVKRSLSQPDLIWSDPDDPHYGDDGWESLEEVHESGIA